MADLLICHLHQWNSWIVKMIITNDIDRDWWAKMESLEVKIISFKDGCGVSFVIAGFMAFAFNRIIKVTDNELASLIRPAASCWQWHRSLFNSDIVNFKSL